MLLKIMLLKENSVIPTQLAQDIYHNFREQNKSEHIAGLTTIQLLLNICQAQKPINILELGGGLGTLTKLLLAYSPTEATLDTYEDNLYFQQKLRENLQNYQPKYTLITDYRILPPKRSYDLVIVDGGNGKTGDGGYPDAVWFIISYLQSVKIIYIEGYRCLQRLLIRKALRRRFIYRLQAYAPAGEKKAGGLKIECRLCHSPFIRWINFLFWEIMEWTSVENFIKYRVNRLVKKFKHV